ncbi:MAG: ATP-binding cassette domain-containing protein [Coriobacteriia bacterium]|nr:ATP-binding cassette domain-containing protein [Coriobacteriia bacterium]
MIHMSGQEFIDLKPNLSAQHLTKIYGPSCEYCQDLQNELDKNVCPRCGSVHALRDVSLEVYPGEIVGIVGESGSGKSTLMRSLYFDQNVDSGEMFLNAIKDGRVNVFDLSEQQKLKIKNNIFGMVYQNPYLGLRMNYSALSNIAERQIAAGSRRVERMQTRALELLDRVNILPSRSGEPPLNFSGGMQQRVQIAKALSSEPPILFLDEITTGLDLSVQAQVLDLILSIAHDLSISMLVVSHDLGVIRMLAHRCYVMLDGRVIEQGLTDQILQDPQAVYTQKLVYSLL